MENLVKKINSNITALITLVLIILSMISLFVFKLSVGPDFHDYKDLALQLDHEVSTDNIAATAAQTLPAAQVLKESTGKFHLYYQNTSQQQLDDLSAKLKEAVPGVISIKTYNVTNTGEIFIATRVLIVAITGLIAYLIYIAWTFKKFDFTRGAILQLLLTELFLLAFSTLVIMGTGSLLGKLGVVMNTVYWDLFLLAIAVVLVFRVYSVFRMRDYAQKEQSREFAVHYQNMYKKYWPEFVFVFCLSIIVTVLPWLVNGKQFLVSAILVGVGCLLSFYNFILLEPHFLNFLSEWTPRVRVTPKKLKGKTPRSNSFWSKKW